MAGKIRYQMFRGGVKRPYQDICVNGQISGAFVEIRIEKNYLHKRGALRLVDPIKDKRELEVLTSHLGFMPGHTRTADFLVFDQNFLWNSTGEAPGIVRGSLEKFNWKDLCR